MILIEESVRKDRVVDVVVGKVTVARKLHLPWAAVGKGCAGGAVGRLAVYQDRLNKTKRA